MSHKRPIEFGFQRCKNGTFTKIGRGQSGSIFLKQCSGKKTRLDAHSHPITTKPDEEGLLPDLLGMHTHFSSPDLLGAMNREGMSCHTFEWGGRFYARCILNEVAAKAWHPVEHLLQKEETDSNPFGDLRNKKEILKHVRGMNRIENKYTCVTDLGRVGEAFNGQKVRVLAKPLTI